MTKTDKATQILAIEKVFTLKKNGVTLKNVKIIVAAEFKTSVHRVTQWMREHAPTTTSDTVLTETNNVVVSRRNEPIKGLGDLSNALFNTIDDLKEGRITHKEASAMSSLAGNITNIKKLQFSAHKYVSKVNTQGITVDKLLGQ